MKIENISVTSQVVAYLKRHIESGDWAVGEKIPSENRMAEELRVSRSSIRTALQHLIGLGVLRSYQGKGTFLINDQVENWDETENKITSEDCRDIYRVLQFRLIVEPEACKLAVRNCTAETISELETCLERMRMSKGDRAGFVRADLKFHEAVCKASGNALLEKSLHKVFSEMMKNNEQMNEIFGYEPGIRYHTSILEAFRNKDGQEAHDRMYLHLDAAMKKL